MVGFLLSKGGGQMSSRKIGVAMPRAMKVKVGVGMLIAGTLLAPSAARAVVSFDTARSGVNFVFDPDVNVPNDAAFGTLAPGSSGFSKMLTGSQIPAVLPATPEFSSTYNRTGG